MNEKNEKLAIYGGTSQRDNYLPYAKQWIDDEDINMVSETLKGELITTGPTIKLFEKKIAEYVGTKYAVAFTSGTAALHGAVCAAGIKKNDKVITTPITFIATANSILYQGGKPIFADIDKNTYNICPRDIEKKVTSKTKAIIQVDYTGQPADIDAILNIAKKNKLVVIEDAAHALGAEYKKQKIGSFSDMTMFSFHPVKHITTGEGGIITTNNYEYYEKLIDFRNHGITRDESKLIDKQGKWYYEMKFLGYNYRMTDIQAALGISQLNKLAKYLNRRKEIADRYNKAFKEIKEIQIPLQAENTSSSWHLYIIRLNLDRLNCNRNQVYEALISENIGVNVHYIPVYYHPFYQELGYKRGICPIAEKVYEEIITLPLFPLMTEKDVNDVIEAVQKVIEYYKVS